MVLKSIKLQNFRNYSQKEFFFDEKMTLVIGPNASGKSNLLEAIYLLATAKSFRAELESEMISYAGETARVKGKITQGDNLEIILTKGQVVGRKVAKKIYQVNGVGKRQIDFLGNLRAVYFGPEDLELVTDSPSTRRKYLDMVLVQVDREYARAQLSYEKGLRARNRVLEAIRETGAPRTQLFFWDQLLIRNGSLMTARREELINFFNSRHELEDYTGLQLDYDKSVVSSQRLEQYKEEEVAAGVTLVGPHRDDWKIKLDEVDNQEKPLRDLSAYGSRGEQRLAILWLKLCELAFIKQKTEELPLLLLDDIFSELDQKHREIVWRSVGNQQTVITTADIEQVSSNLRKLASIINLAKI